MMPYFLLGMNDVAASVITDRHTQSKYCNPAVHAPMVKKRAALI